MGAGAVLSGLAPGNAGDTILFGKYSGQEIKLDGEEFLIMREDEVLGVIEGGSSEPTTKR